MNHHQSDPPIETGRDVRGLILAAQNTRAGPDPYQYVGAAISPGNEAPTDFQVNLLEYLRIVIKYRRLILGIVAASVVLGVVVTLMKTPLYISTVRLQINREVAKIVEGGNVTPVEGGDNEFLKTQFEPLQ